MKTIQQIAQNKAMIILSTDTLNTKTTLVSRAMAEGIKEFTTAILHGSENHREWLMAAANAYCEGKPLPPVMS